MADSTRPVRIVNPLPKTNNRGINYPRWHARHPRNGVVVPKVVAPTVKQ